MWEGPSPYTGEPIAIIATGITEDSANVATGGMVQVCAIRTDMHPAEARKLGSAGAMSAACGTSCPRQRDGSCYVRTDALASIYHAYKRGSYARVVVYRGACALFAGRDVRLGMSGCPSTFPGWILRAVRLYARSWTGYTHEWRSRPDLRGMCMASVDTLAEYHKARAMGWRCFLVLHVGADAPDGTIRCPKSVESGLGRTCVQCRLCSGQDGRPGAKSIAIWDHAGSNRLAGIKAAAALRSPRLTVLA